MFPPSSRDVFSSFADSLPTRSANEEKQNSNTALTESEFKSSSNNSIASSQFSPPTPSTPADSIRIIPSSNENSSVQSTSSNSASASAAASVAGSPLIADASNFKTELCSAWRSVGHCQFAASCAFAHGADEIRPRHFGVRYKLQTCKNYHSRGQCRFESRCKFIHDEFRYQMSPFQFCLISPQEQLVRIEQAQDYSRIMELIAATQSIENRMKFSKLSHYWQRYVIKQLQLSNQIWNQSVNNNNAAAAAAAAAQAIQIQFEQLQLENQQQHNNQQNNNQNHSITHQNHHQYQQQQQQFVSSRSPLLGYPMSFPLNEFSQLNLSSNNNINQHQHQQQLINNNSAMNQQLYSSSPATFAASLMQPNQLDANQLAIPTLQSHSSAIQFPSIPISGFHNNSPAYPILSLNNSSVGTNVSTFPIDPSDLKHSN